MRAGVLDRTSNFRESNLDEAMFTYKRGSWHKLIKEFNTTAALLPMWPNDPHNVRIDRNQRQPH